MWTITGTKPEADAQCGQELIQYNNDNAANCVYYGKTLVSKSTTYIYNLKTYKVRVLKMCSFQ